MKRICFFTGLIMSLFVFTGCDDNDDRTHPDSQEVENTFKAMYPDASRVDWERKGDYWIVDFWKNAKEMEAWFDLNGEWYQTETDLIYTDLPEAVKTAFQSGEYKDWRVDDVDLIERKDTEKFYVLDVEKKGSPDYDLHYSIEGTLIKAVADPS